MLTGCRWLLQPRFGAAIVLVAWLVSGKYGLSEEPLTNADERATSLTRLKRAAEVYTITFGNNDVQEKLQLIESPVLRFSDPVSSVPDGAMFLWTRDSRPEAAAAFWSNTGGRAWVEFQSLSLRPLHATRLGIRDWHPEKPGIEFKPLSAGSAPDKSESQRLTQMRSMLRSFTASISDSRGGRQELRALPQPVYRYSQMEGGIIDGALFVFARSTNPELLVLIEVQIVNGKPEWQYAPARMTGRDCELRYLDKPVWSQPTVGREVDRERPYLQLNTQLPD